MLFRSACVDISDGLADAVRQVAAASGTGAVIEAAAVPVHAGVQAWAADTGHDPLALALSGGEDYELLFAVGRRQDRAFRAVAGRTGVPVTAIGRLTAEPAAWLERDGTRQPLGHGFSHFSGR